MSFKFLFHVFCLGVFFVSHAQSRTEHYVLPQFTKGTLLMKNGQEKSGIFNYNAFTQKIAIKKGDDILALADSEAVRVDTVYMQKRKFIYKDNKVLEFLMSTSVELFVDYECSLKTNTEDSNAYGSSSQTTSAVVASEFDNQGFFYNLELPDLYIAELKYRYRYYKNSQLTLVKSLNQIKKLYPKHKKQFSAYKKSNDVDFENPSSIKGLVEYMESLE